MVNRVDYITQRIPDLLEGDIGRRAVSAGDSSGELIVFGSYRVLLENGGREIRVSFDGNKSDVDVIYRELEKHQKTGVVRKGKPSFPINLERDRRILDRVYLSCGEEGFSVKATLRLRGEKRRQTKNQEHIAGAVYRSAFLPIVNSIIKKGFYR